MQSKTFRLMGRLYLPLIIGLSLMTHVIPTWAADIERERTLIIGKVSPNPKKHYRYLKPIAEYVVKQMSDLGIDKVKVLMAKNNRQMISYIKRGKVDWVTETVFSALEFEEEAGAEMILLKHKKGVPVYHTVFFTRNDSGIETLQDLKGKVITFEDPGSTTGFFVPASLMINSGLKLVKLESPREKISDDSVGYVFANAEINMSTWVHKGLVDAGAYANLDWYKEDHNPTSFKESMNIFHQSEEFPRAIELVRQDLKLAVKARLKSILLQAHKDADADMALRAYQKTTRFEEINGSVMQGIKRARSILMNVKAGLVF